MGGDQLGEMEQEMAALAEWSRRSHVGPLGTGCISFWYTVQPCFAMSENKIRFLEQAAPLGLFNNSCMIVFMQGAGQRVSTKWMGELCWNGVLALSQLYRSAYNMVSSVDD